MTLDTVTRVAAAGSEAATAASPLPGLISAAVKRLERNLLGAFHKPPAVNSTGPNQSESSDGS